MSTMLRVVMVASVLLGSIAAAQPAADWGARLAGMSGGDWRRAFETGLELASLPPDEGYAVVREHWGRVTDYRSRQQILKAFFFTTPHPLRLRVHPHHFRVMNLAMNDPDRRVQQWAMEFLKQSALRDFTRDFTGYIAWNEDVRDRPTAEVMAEGARAVIAGLAGEDASARRAALAMLTQGANLFRDVPEVRRAAVDGGLLDRIETWISAEDPGNDEVAAGMALLESLGADEAYMRRVVLPVTQRGKRMDLRVGAVGALGTPGNGWAVEPLLGILTGTLEDEQEFKNLLWPASMALGRIGDTRAIPTMIGVIEADNTYATVYGVGWFGLHPLTNVEYDEVHDAAWWRKWWEENKGTLPEPVRAAEIPRLARTFTPSGEPTGDPDAAVVTQDLRIGGDENKRYFQIGPAPGAAAPGAGYKLVVVLPGGDGSAEFLGFVQNIAASALPPGYIVAQAVAPKWTEDENRIVWPTRKLPDPKMKFGAEEFVAEIVADVKSRHAIDARCVLALGWSSGGPACYAASLTEGTPITGVFVAMSVFKPATLPGLEAAKGRPYFLLHSPQDFIAMSFPEAAERQLSAAGAMVRLETYKGGHGWHGDVYGNIRRGVEWLESKLAGP